jgi:hypothetical protein
MSHAIHFLMPARTSDPFLDHRMTFIAQAPHDLPPPKEGVASTCPSVSRISPLLITV